MAQVFLYFLGGIVVGLVPFLVAGLLVWKLLRTEKS